MIDFRSRKIQVLAAFLLLVIALVAYFGFKQFFIEKTNVPVKAIEISMEGVSPSTPNDSEEAYDLRVLNVSESAFTIFFRTKEPTKAFIRVGKNNELTWKVPDARSINKKDAEYYNHFFQFSDPAAKAESTYVYLLEINGKRDDNEGKLYSVNMAPLLSSPPSPSYLEIFLSVPNETDYKDTIMIASNYDSDSAIESGYTGSQVTKSSSILSLGSLRTVDKSAYSTLSKIKVEIFEGDKQYTSSEFLDFDSDSVYNLVLR